MQLFYFLAIVLSLSFGSVPRSEHSISHALEFSGLVILAWWILIYLAVRLVSGLIRDGEVNEVVGYDWFERQTECFRWLSLGLIFLCLGGFGIAQAIHQIPVVQDALSLQAIILLTPAVAMMVGLWVGEYWFARKLGYVNGGLLRALGAAWQSFRGSIGWLLMPVLGFMFVIDMMSLLSLGNLVPSYVGWIIVAIAVLTAVPMLVRRVFPTKKLEKDQRTRIEAIVSAAGIRNCNIVQWDTGRRTHNAMMAGALGRFRFLLVSDRLMDELTDEELTMVVLHEVAHAKRWHIPLRILALLPAWGMGFSVERFLGGATAANLFSESAADWAASIGCLVSLIGTVLVLRFVSYISEYDADAVACVLAPQIAEACKERTVDGERGIDGVPATLDEARRHLASALLRVTSESDAARKRSWLHPGIMERIKAITDLQAIPDANGISQSI